MSISKGTDDKIGLGVALITGINAMVGAGVVSIPGFLAKQVGPAGLLSYVLSIVVVLSMSLSLARLAQKYPGPGWSYLYPKVWGGHRLALLTTGTYLLGVMVAMGFLVQQGGLWLSHVFGGFSPDLLGFVCLFILTLLVLGGAQISSWGQYLIGFMVVGCLLAITGVCLGHFQLENWQPFMPSGWGGVILAAPKAMFTLIGFECVASLYSVLKNPHRTVPLACAGSVLTVGSLYLIFTAAVLGAIPVSYLVSGGNQSLVQVLENYFPQYPFVHSFVLLAGLAAIIGTIHSMLWSSSQLLRDTFSKINAPFVQGLLKKGVWGLDYCVCICAFFMLGSFLTLESEMILNITVCFIALSYTLSLLTLILDKSEWQTGFNVVASVGFVGGLLMVFYSLLPML